MKISSLLLLLLLSIVIVLNGCSQSPGPLADGNSRIEIKCSGIGGADLDVVFQGTTEVLATTELGCFFTGKAYMDVPVPPPFQPIPVLPPYNYNIRVKVDSDTGPKKQTIDTVSFTRPGQQITIRYHDYNILKAIKYSGEF